MTSSNETSAGPEKKEGGLLSARTAAVGLCVVLLVGLNLYAVALVLNQQQVIDAQLSDIARKGVALDGERGKVEADKARIATAQSQLIEITRQIDGQTIVMERQRVEQRDLDQRKRDRDTAIAERDDASRGKRDAEMARDKAQLDARSAANELTVARDALQAARAEVTVLEGKRSVLEREAERMTRDRESIQAVLRKAEEERKAADSETQQSNQRRDEAKRATDTARDAAVQAKTELTGLEARRSDATSALQRMEERRRITTNEAEAEEARLKKARAELATTQVEYRAFLDAEPQRSAAIAKQLQAAQSAQNAVMVAEEKRQEALRNLGTAEGQLSAIQAQLAAARTQQAQLPNLQAQVTTATQQLAALQQQQTPLQNNINNRNAALAKIQADMDSLGAEIRNLTAARDMLLQAVGQRGQLERDLKALNDEIGQRRADVARLRSEADQASTERQASVVERATAERQRADLATQLNILQPQRDQLDKALATTSALVAKADASLAGTLRQRDAAELDVMRLRNLSSAMASSNATQTAPVVAPIKQEAP